MSTIQISIYILVALITLALAFGFMSGFHDAANSISTVVSTGVLKPHTAVAMAAIFNFAAIFIFQLGVAATIGKETIDADIVGQYLVFGALTGAMFWTIVAWFLGIPSSTTHALIGGLIGAAVAKVGTDSLIASGLVKIIGFILLAPLLGFILGSLMMLLISWMFVRSAPRTIDKWFRAAQLVSASMYSVGHGGNNAQKMMGIIWMLLIAAGVSTASDPLPTWVIVSCYSAISLGTLFGGWRVVKTMGQRITKLKPVGGFSAETGGAATLFFATALGIPVSTTHTMTGAVMGVGASQRMTAVRWGIAGNMVWAWVFTIPASAFAAAIFWWIGTHLF